MKAINTITSAKQAFTLVELLVVMLILAALSAIGIGAYSSIELTKKEEQAKIIIAKLESSLEEYFNSSGEYPKPHDANLESSSSVVYAALYGDFDGDGTPDDGEAIYFTDLNPDIGSKGNRLVLPNFQGGKGSHVIMDPWSKPYRYQLGFNRGGNGKNPDFDVWSAGADGIDGTDDDIGNFKGSASVPATKGPAKK